MAAHARFHLKTLEDLKAELDRLGLALPLSTDLGILGEPVAIGSRKAPNRFAVQPMEGFDAAPDGGPGELCFRRYTRYAAGGTGLIWFEATAVLEEARSNPSQLWLHAGNAARYRDLVAATRKAAREACGHDPVLVLQLTHSGRYSKPHGAPRPLIAHHSGVLDPKHNLPPDYPLVTDDYLDRLQDTYVAAAKMAAEAGFDGIDIKSCHRYLVSELLASFTREGRYGGSFENRARLLLETLARVRSEVPGVFITTRMNAYDAIPHPFGFGVDREDYRKPDLAEPIELARRLEALGAPLLNVSIGNPYYNPHYGRPFDFPIKGMACPEEHPLEAIARFAAITAQMQAAVPAVPVIASGYTWLRHLMPHLAAGVIRQGGAALVGQGRGAFAYPDSVKDLLKNGAMDPGQCCITCSACTQIMRDGGQTGCVVRDSAVYGPEYRKARQRALDHLTEESKRCRGCESPTCQAACPAHVDVPGFVAAFREGRYRAAYDLLRQANALPELCACVCPSEVQCEGHCVESSFTENPVPIKAIQGELSRMARREGWTGVRLPAQARRGRVAVVGAGPAGLACAIRLLEHGRNVTLFDRSPAAGGTPDQLIPAERLDRAGPEIDAILAPAFKAGRAVLQNGVELGRDLSLDDLARDFDAVFLAVGLGGGTALSKTSLPGVWDALDFLAKAKRGLVDNLPAKVAVIGGGNTAMDAACTARRLGVRDVYLLYRRSFSELPAWPAERDHALRKNVHFLILTQPLGYVAGPDGKVAGVRVTRTELGEPDASGRRAPVSVPNSESVVEAGLVVEAIGQRVPDALRQALKGLAFTPDGRVQTRPNSTATSRERVFAGGDLVNGGATAVRGVWEGMQAAAEINERLG
jgi:2,4-dienoyl-CoA reductase (NADPH2)